MSSIGNRIKELLNKQDISQKDLARYIGTTEASISRYVNDEREPVAKILYKIAQELHTTTDYLISGTPSLTSSFGIYFRRTAGEDAGYYTVTACATQT